MSNHAGILYGGVPVSDISDEDLLTAISERGGRKIQDNTAEVWAGFLRVFDEIESPMTVRQMYYQLETMGVVPKDEAGYRIVQRQLLRARRARFIPYDWIADNTRWMRKPDTYNSLDSFLKISQDSYRRAIWAQQPTYVEIWIEKDALTGVIQPVTSKWDVPLMSIKGYSSESFAYGAAENIRTVGKPAYVYYFGDRDPSGVNISEDLEKKLSGFLKGSGIPFHYERVAVTEEQIEVFNLPTRPTKRTDTRAKNWKGESCELDAIRADDLRSMVEEVIKRHIDPKVYESTMVIEEQERSTLRNLVLEQHFTGAGSV
jgi:hypothetical protein